MVLMVFSFLSIGRCRCVDRRKCPIRITAVAAILFRVRPVVEWAGRLVWAPVVRRRKGRAASSAVQEVAQRAALQVQQPV